MVKKPTDGRCRYRDCSRKYRYKYDDCLTYKDLLLKVKGDTVAELCPEGESIGKMPL